MSTMHHSYLVKNVKGHSAYKIHHELCEIYRPTVMSEPPGGLLANVGD